MNSGDSAAALAAIRGAQFDWAMQLQEVWDDAACDVPQINGKARREVANQLASMAPGGRSKSPLGWVFVGPGGCGKTHLLGAIRREAAAKGACFVLVDMTDVRDFWDVVLQGYLDSLQTPYIEGQYQYEALLKRFIQSVASQGKAPMLLERLTTRKSAALGRDVKQVVDFLRRRHAREALHHQDAVRALICLNSHDIDIANAGYSWLQGQEIEAEIAKVIGFQRLQQSPRTVIAALSWFMSLSGPTVVAFDQLDPIVHQVSRHKLDSTDESQEAIGTARAIIEQIGGGLAGMRDTVTNSLLIVSCLESTWRLLNDLVLQTYQDRFQAPIRIHGPSDADAFRSLVAGRLAPANRDNAFAPPYPTWPFAASAFDRLLNSTAREVLKLCEDHRRRCLENSAVGELTSFDLSPGDADSHTAAGLGLEPFDQRFERLHRAADPAYLLDQKHEDERMAPLYRAALECYVHEHDLPRDIDAVVETKFAGGKTTVPLHARLRFVFHGHGGKEQHFCVRVSQRTHHAAFTTRLKAAMTQSGIDKALNFRHLTIIRVGHPPGGEKTQKLTAQFRAAGGRFHEPSENEIRCLAALEQLSRANDPGFSAWLRRRLPVTRLGLGSILAPGSPWLDSPAAPAETTAVPSFPTPALPAQTPASTQPPCPAAEATTPTTRPADERAQPAPSLPDVSPPRPAPCAAELPLGRRVLGRGTFGELVTLPVATLAKHVMILGGAGSGKSVTVRRLVEEAALAGIPSIIVDCAQDMALFDTDWDHPQQPAWREGDAQRAARFRSTVEQIVWTPGSLNSGNPLCLRPLPDFTPVRDDPEELRDAVMMVCDGLRDIVAKGASQKSQNKEGILIKSLTHFAKQFPSGGLSRYIEYLQDLPSDAELGIASEIKLANEMASSLIVEQTRNPLLEQSGVMLDPLLLFGDDSPRNKIRLSVISLVKLKGQAAPQSFLNQLAMLLFSWIKAHPTPPHNRALRGLLVIDEARDFVPSGRATACKESLMRLAAQARKYRLGLIFATQHPKDVETKIVGNCATHFYGLNNSPASLDTLKDLMAQKGGVGDDIPRLTPGQFYVHNAEAGHKAPIKIQVPLSLSYSPRNPLDENQILAKARASRAVLAADNRRRADWPLA